MPGILMPDQPQQQPTDLLGQSLPTAPIYGSAPGQQPGQQTQQQQPTPTGPKQSLGQLFNTWANAQNQNAYGHDPGTPQGQQALASLASAGFPMFNDPRIYQDRLANMLQGNIPLPQGYSMQDVQDEFWRQMGSGGGGRGGYGGGMGGDTAETAAAAAEHEESAAAAGGGGSNLYG